MNIYDAISQALNVSTTPTASRSSYETTIVGDGVTSVFNINHNLGSLSAAVLVIDPATQEQVLPDIIYYSNNTYKLEFDSNEIPAVGKTYTVYVSKSVTILPEPEYITLNEPYIMKVYVYDTKEYADTVDLKVNSIHLPMEHNDVEFFYEVTKKQCEKVLGNYRFYKYFPIGSTISLDGVNVTVLSYTTPIKIKNEWYVTMNGSISGTLPDGLITDAAKENKILYELTSIVHSNNNIKKLLKYYDSNVIDLINNTNLTTAIDVIKDINATDRIVYNGYQNEISDDLDNSGPLVTDATKFRSFYEFEKDTVQYGTLSDSVNCKTLSSWLFNSNIATKSWSDVVTKFSNLVIPCINGGECKIKYEKYTGGSSNIVLYTPSVCTYNIVLFVKSFTTNLGRVYPTLGFAMIDKSGNAGSETVILHSTGTDDKWEWISSMIYNMTGDGKSEYETISEYFLNTFPQIYSEYTEVFPDYTTAVFTRYEYSSNGYIGKLTIDGTMEIEF